jgi:hypothetical protein
MGTKTGMCITRFNRTESIALDRNILRNDCCDAVRILLSASRIDEQRPRKDRLACKTSKPADLVPHGRDSDMPLSDPGE